MGTGYTLRCKGCGYKISANLGVGFLFPMAYQETMEAAREGKFGKTFQQFLLEHPDGTLNIETLFNFPTICPTISEVKNCSFMRMIFLEIYKIVVKYTINGNCAGKNTQK